MRVIHFGTAAGVLCNLTMMACGPAIADEPLRLRLAPELSSEPAPPNAPAFARADKVQSLGAGQTVLLGSAELRRGDTRVRGDRIAYNEIDDEVRANGTVRLARDGVLLSGPALRLRLAASEGNFEQAAFSVPAVLGRGWAQRIDFLGKGKLRLNQVTYTTCSPERPAWFLRAKTVYIDEAAGNPGSQDGPGGEAVLTGAQIDFFGRTLIALPDYPISLPIGEGRQTGFLLPTGRISSRTGLSITAPYYWDIAPNRDLTLYPRLLSRRGVQMGGVFRYLEPNQVGDLRIEALPGDRSAGRDRWFFASTHKFNDVGGWSGGWTARGVSDDQYFADFSTSILGASERSLPREVFANRTIGDWTLLMRAASFQNILEAKAAPPYARVPQIAARWDSRGLGGLDFASGFDVSRFERPLSASPAGWRVIVNPSMAWTYRTPGVFVTPRVSAHASQYWIEPGGQLGTGNLATGAAAVANTMVPTGLTRALPTVSVDAGMVFERPWRGLDERQWVQTLEPRVYYVRTPYRDQSAFPVFDTAQADFNFAQLFSSNTFVGNDRIADVHQLTTAMVSRLLDPGNGREALRVGVGQRVYFGTQRVTIAGEAPRTDTRSDLLAAVSAVLNQAWTFDGGLQANLAEGRVPRFNLTTRWNPRPEQILNLTYRYRRDLVDQVDLSAQWPLADRWYVMGRFNWTLAELAGIRPGVVEALAGAEYRDDCWATRVVLQQYVTSVATKSTAVSVQLELSGLAKIGSDPSAILSRSIPGWRPHAERDLSPGRYFGYE
jgi:LPS-assembly protein